MCKFVAVCVWNSARGRKQQRFLIVTPHALLPHTTAPLDKTATDSKQANLHFHQPSPQVRPISRVSFPHHKVQTPIGHIKVFLFHFYIHLPHPYRYLVTSTLSWFPPHCTRFSSKRLKTRVNSSHCIAFLTHESSFSITRYPTAFPSPTVYRNTLLLYPLFISYSHTSTQLELQLVQHYLCPSTHTHMCISMTHITISSEACVARMSISLVSLFDSLNFVAST